MILITNTIILMFFMVIDQALAGTWQCPEKTPGRHIKYTILFDSPGSGTDTITMRHIDTQTNQDAFGALNLKVTRRDDKSKIAVLTTPYTISTYYFDLEKGLVTRSKINGSIAHGSLIKSVYKCKI